MLIYQLHDLLFTIRFPVAQTDPHGNGQAELGSHNFRISFCQNALLNQVFHQPGEVLHHVSIILLGLEFRQFRVLELLHHQHFPRLSDMGIMEDISNLSLNHLNNGIKSHREVTDIFLPIYPYKNRMRRILVQYFFHQRIQNGYKAMLYGCRQRLQFEK